MKFAAIVMIMLVMFGLGNSLPQDNTNEKKRRFICGKNRKAYCERYECHHTQIPMPDYNYMCPPQLPHCCGY